MNPKFILIIVSVFVFGCSSTQANLSNNWHNDSAYMANEEGDTNSLNTDREENPDKVITFSVIEEDDLKNLPGDAIVKPKCLKGKKVCFKKTVYAPDGLNRKLRIVSALEDDKQTIRFQPENFSNQKSSNFCFRVVMFTDIDDFEIHTENTLGLDNGLNYQNPRKDEWKLSGCEIREGKKSGVCKFWRNRELSPFTEIYKGQVRRKYFPDYELERIFFYPQEGDFEKGDQQETLFYAIEAKAKVGRGEASVCPAASFVKDLTPERISGDPRMRITIPPLMR